MRYCILSAVLLLPAQAQLPDSYRKNAQAALQSQVSQIGKDCPDAKTTIEVNGCILAVGKKTKADFETFYESLRALLGQKDDAVSQLAGSQDQWESYAQKACNAIDSFFQGGDLRFSAGERCRIQLTRSRMQDLNALYYTILHP